MSLIRSGTRETKRKEDIGQLLDMLAELDEPWTEADERRARAIRQVLAERRRMLADLEESPNA